MYNTFSTALESVAQTPLADSLAKAYEEGGFEEIGKAFVRIIETHRQKMRNERTSPCQLDWIQQMESDYVPD